MSLFFERAFKSAQDYICFVVFLLVAGWSARKVLKWRKGDVTDQRWEARRTGTCVKCGYDVSAGKGERCPEYGTAVDRWWRPESLNAGKLARDLPAMPAPEPRAHAEGEIPIVVYSTCDRTEADLLVKHLKGRGASAWLEETVRRPHPRAELQDGWDVKVWSVDVSDVLRVIRHLRD